MALINEGQGKRMFEDENFVISEIKAITPYVNPFLEDSYNMGKSLGNDVMAMMANHDTDPCKYVILVHIPTGRRIVVEFAVPEDKVVNQEDWSLIIQYIHWNGAFYHSTPKEIAAEIYSRANGFGDYFRDPAKLATINGGWDWSHIWASSPYAVRRMADYIRQLIKEGELPS